MLLLAVLVKVRVVVAVVEARPSRRIVVLRLLGILLVLRLVLLLRLILLLCLLLAGNRVLDGRHMAVTALVVAPERHVGGNTGKVVRQWVARLRSKGVLYEVRKGGKCDAIGVVSKSQNREESWQSDVMKGLLRRCARQVIPARNLAVSQFRRFDFQ